MYAIELHRNICRFQFFCCRYCFGIFINREKLLIHQKTYNHINNKQIISYKIKNKTINTCKFCHKQFNRKWELKMHERIHRNIRPEICKFCNKTFTEPSTKRKHIKQIHNNGIPKPYKCKKCYKQFRMKKELKNHLTSHLKRQKKKK
eukprot:232468_1